MPTLLDGLRILVLEDEFLIAMDVEQLCRDHGAQEVVIARDLTEIDGRKVATQFDAAIVDLMLGGTSTLEFAAGLRETGVPLDRKSTRLNSSHITPSRMPSSA